MSVKARDPKRPWTDYLVTNRLSGKTYRVALRGSEAGDSYCSCPDFRTNTLGTCKHVLRVLANAKRRFTPRQLRRPFRPQSLALHLRYAGEVSLRLLVPDTLDEEAVKIVGPLRDRPIEDLHDLLKRVARLQRLGQDVTIYPDAEEFIQQRTLQERLRDHGGGYSPGSRRASAAHRPAYAAAVALSAGWNRLRGRCRPGDFGGRHGAWKNHAGGGSGGALGPRGGNPQSVDHLPGFA